MSRKYSIGHRVHSLERLALVKKSVYDRGSPWSHAKHSNGHCLPRPRNYLDLAMGRLCVWLELRVSVREKRRRRGRGGQRWNEKERRDLRFGKKRNTGGEALLLTRKRNNSHRHANRTNIQNAQSFLTAVSTAIFVPRASAILHRWEFIEPWKDPLHYSM